MSQQCAAITITGQQCSRNAEAGSKYCWQHQNYETERKVVSNPKKYVKDYFDTAEFRRLVRKVHKSSLSDSEMSKIIAHGPINIFVESKHYIRIPDIDFTLQPRDYTFGQIFEMIEEEFHEIFTYEFFKDLVDYEEKEYQSRTPSQKQKAFDAQEFYSDLYQRYDPEDVMSVLYDATYTGPDTSGNYYIRL